ncbi:MAG: hypothetical protein ACRDTR_11560, partial [Rubrobacter sp.]
MIKPYTKGPRTARIRSLPVNLRTAWLYGMWLAEGSLYRGGLKWSFGAHEAESLARKVIDTLEEEFGRISTRFLRPEKNLCEVACSSTDLSALFGHWFGHGCEDKRVPAEALGWTKRCQEALVQGYMEGDGSCSDGFTTATSVSEDLAYGIFALCVQTRKAAAVSALRPRLGRDGVKRKKCYVVSVRCKESLKGFYADIDGTTHYWSEVQEVAAESDTPKTVVDISTTGSHTFVTKMGATHNCQRGGDTIKLVSELKNLAFGEAVSYLAERSDINLQYEGSEADAEAAKKRNARRRTIHKALAAAAVYYHKYLLNARTPEAQQAREYLK